VFPPTADLRLYLWVGRQATDVLRIAAQETATRYAEYLLNRHADGTDGGDTAPTTTPSAVLQVVPEGKESVDFTSHFHCWTRKVFEDPYEERKARFRRGDIPEENPEARRAEERRAMEKRRRDRILFLRKLKENRKRLEQRLRLREEEEEEERKRRRENQERIRVKLRMIEKFVKLYNTQNGHPPVSHEEKVNEEGKPPSPLETSPTKAEKVEAISNEPTQKEEENNRKEGEGAVNNTSVLPTEPKPTNPSTPRAGSRIALDRFKEKQEEVLSRLRSRTAQGFTSSPTLPLSAKGCRVTTEKTGE